MKEKTIERIRKFTEDRDWDQFHSPANLAKSIVIEAAELLECFQWSDTEYDLQHIKEELADVINYCILMADDSYAFGVFQASKGYCGSLVYRQL